MWTRPQCWCTLQAWRWPQRAERGSRRTWLLLRPSGSSLLAGKTACCTAWCVGPGWGDQWLRRCSWCLHHFFFKFYVPCLHLCPQQGSVWSRCVNEELLWLGLARTAPIAGVQPDSRIYWRLHKRLHKAEVKAERRGRGLWQRDSMWERISRVFRDSSFVRLMRRIFQKTWWHSLFLLIIFTLFCIVQIL